MEFSEQLTGFELEDLMPWTVSNLQRPFREDFSLEKSGIIAEKESQIFGRRFVGFDRPKKRRPFSISKRALEVGNCPRHEILQFKSGQLL